MGLELNRAFGVGAITPNIYTNRNKTVSFKSGTDSVEISSLDRFTNETAIRKMIANNPNIKKIAKNYNPNLNLNIQELRELLLNHSKDTQNIAKGVITKLPFSLQTQVDTKAIENAAYLHDLGKVLIPKEILNKPARLNEEETKIMQTHSQISYELLKNSGLNDKTLNLIRNHHQNAKRSGYPFVKNDFNADLELQILSAADKFSALTEKRTYKEPLSDKQALTIIYQDVKEGKLHPFVFKALVNYSQEIYPVQKSAQTYK